MIVAVVFPVFHTFDHIQPADTSRPFCQTDFPGHDEQLLSLYWPCNKSKEILYIWCEWWPLGQSCKMMRFFKGKVKSGFFLDTKHIYQCLWITCILIAVISRLNCRVKVKQHKTFEWRSTFCEQWHGTHLHLTVNERKLKCLESMGVKVLCCHDATNNS